MAPIRVNRLFLIIAPIYIAIKSGHLPSFCSCVDGANYASTLTCSVTLLHKLEVGLIGQLSPCALPATVSLDISTLELLPKITDSCNTLPTLTRALSLTHAHLANPVPIYDAAGPDGFDFRIATLRTGTKKTIPIPGLSVAIPIVGSAGVVLDFQLDGNLNDLQVEIGFDACVTTRIGQECGSALTSLLPVWLLNQTLSFTSVCQ
jgi:hypothetical protein